MEIGMKRSDKLTLLAAAIAAAFTAWMSTKAPSAGWGLLAIVFVVSYTILWLAFMFAAAISKIVDK